MLIINDDLFEKEKIIKLSGDDNWVSHDSVLLTKCALDSLKSLMNQNTVRQSIILIVDIEKGTLPPIKIGIEIAKNFFDLKSTISKNVDFSILYVKTEESKQWIDKILSVYTPVRPLYFLEHKSDIKKALKLSKRGAGIDHTKDILSQLSVLDDTVSVKN